MPGLTRAQTNKLINKYFGKIVGGKSNDDLLGSYATFDPVDGLFKFSGTMPIGRPEVGRFSYLSLTISGDLMDNSYIALFNDSKLNHNVSAKAAYNFRFGKTRSAYSQDEYNYYKIKDSTIALKARIERQRIIEFGKKKAEEEQQQIVTQLIYSKSKLILIGTSISGVNKVVMDLNSKVVALFNKDSLARAVIANQVAFDKLSKKEQNVFESIVAQTPDSLTKYLTKQKMIADSLTKLITERDHMIDLQNRLSVKKDSLGLVVNDWPYVKRVLREKNIVAEKSERDTLFDEFKLLSYHIGWFTFTAEGGDKKYYNYNRTLPFGQQIVKDYLLTYKFGLIYNYYSTSLRNSNVFYGNVGVSFARDNNTGLLSTTTVTQEVAYKNANADTTRKIVSSFNAYTDSITIGETWSLAANAYYLFNNGSHGFHLFPSFSKIKRQSIYTNLGIGYTASFEHAKKEKPIVNAEIYFQLTDLFDDLHTSTTLKSRSEFGIRFGLPFTLFLK